MLDIETEQPGDLRLALLHHVVCVPLAKGDHPVPVVRALEAVGRRHHVIVADQSRAAILT